MCAHCVLTVSRVLRPRDAQSVPFRIKCKNSPLPLINPLLRPLFCCASPSTQHEMMLMKKKKDEMKRSRVWVCDNTYEEQRMNCPAGCGYVHIALHEINIFCTVRIFCQPPTLQNLINFSLGTRLLLLSRFYFAILLFAVEWIGRELGYKCKERIT